MSDEREQTIFSPFILISSLMPLIMKVAHPPLFRNIPTNVQCSCIDRLVSDGKRLDHSRQVINSDQVEVDDANCFAVTAAVAASHDHVGLQAEHTGEEAVVDPHALLEEECHAWEDLCHHHGPKHLHLDSMEQFLSHRVL
jgi:hypothetical protein